MPEVRTGVQGGLRVSPVDLKVRFERLTRRRKIHRPIGWNHEQSPNIPVQVHIPHHIIGSPGIGIDWSRPSLIKYFLNLRRAIVTGSLVLVRLNVRILRGHAVVFVEAG
jgi:hypothetical protein